MLFFDEPVIGCKDTGDGSEENGVSAHEGKECFCRARDLPWNDNPASNDGGDHATSFDVDEAWEEDCQIVCGRNGVRCDICSDLGDVLGCSGEESCCSTAVTHLKPLGDDIERVPEKLAVNDTHS